MEKLINDISITNLDEENTCGDRNGDNFKEISNAEDTVFINKRNKLLEITKNRLITNLKRQQQYITENNFFINWKGFLFYASIKKEHPSVVFQGFVEDDLVCPGLMNEDFKITDFPINQKKYHDLIQKCKVYLDENTMIHKPAWPSDWNETWTAILNTTSLSENDAPLLHYFDIGHHLFNVICHNS